MGSSCGISVFLTNSSFSVSVSKETVMITPGFTHVPHIKWCFVMLAADVWNLETRVYVNLDDDLEMHESIVRLRKSPVHMHHD